MINRVELHLLDYIEEVVRFDDENAALVQQPTNPPKHLAKRRHVSEYVCRCDYVGFTIFSHYLVGQSFRKEALQRVDAVLRPGNRGNVGRLDAERAHAKRLKPGEQRAVVRPDIDAE